MRVEFPAVLHLRCTAAMRDEVKQRGGGRWLRKLIEANTLPFDPNVSPAIASDTPAGSGEVSRVAGKRATKPKAPCLLQRDGVSCQKPAGHRGKHFYGRVFVPGGGHRGRQKRVSLDKGKPRRVKSRVSRAA